jgi:hypothetical protein
MSHVAAARFSFAAVACVVLGTLAGPSWADASLDTTGRGASARLNFVIKIPPILRIIDNSHPVQLPSNADGVAVVVQRLELQSNLKQGFCVTLKQPDSGSLAWSMEATGNANFDSRPVQGGYHICFSRPGRHIVNLQHSFRFKDDTSPAVRLWPLQTEIAAI